jgi:hypothetical protein
MAKEIQNDEPQTAVVDAVAPATDNGDHERMKLDEMTKEQFFDMTPEQVIRFTNKNLGTDFPLDAEFHWLSTETVNNKTLRRSDIEYSIAGHRFHIEFESGKNGDLSLRMFEYGGRSAWANRWKDAEGFEHTRYPAQCVFYVRGDEGYPTQQKMFVEYPQEDGSFAEIAYFYRAKRIVDYDVDKLIDDFALPLMPYLPYKYLKPFKGISGNVPTELEQNMWKLFTAVNRMVADRLITEEQAAQMWLDSKEILQDTLRDTTIENLKGATDMTTTGTLKEFDTVYVTSIKKIKERERREEREKAVKERENAIIGLKKEKTPDSVIARVFNIPLEQVQAVRA